MYDTVVIFSGVDWKGSRCHLSSATAAITKVHRKDYLLHYLTTIVLPDGSSITARYHEPKQIIKLPVDLSAMTEEEAKARIAKRRPKTKIKIQKQQPISFNASKYIDLIKNK